MAGAVQGFDRLYAGHGQLIGHARLSRHFRAEIAQHNQPLQWPVLTRTCAAGFDCAMTDASSGVVDVLRGIQNLAKLVKSAEVCHNRNRVDCLRYVSFFLIWIAHPHTRT